MPLAKVRGVNINYRIAGTQGPWVALTPGGRNSHKKVEAIGELIAAAGYRVVLHDRRNCGASDVAIGGDDAEYEIWADDLHELLKQLDALPAFIGGCSAGCRTSVVFGIRHAEAARGLLLWRVTGGEFATQRLSHQNYGSFIAVAERGGMAAICETEHFRERIEERPANRQLLMAMDPKRFTAALSHWNDLFVRGAKLPMIGATEAQIKALTMPACVIPGNDNTHPRWAGENLGRLLPHAELHVLFAEDYDLDTAPEGTWEKKDPEVATLLVDFMKRVRQLVAL